MVKSNIYILAFILLVNTAVFCQKIEQDWKRVKPLSTEKATVDKLWGIPEIDKDGHIQYETDDAKISVIYSTEPCEGNKYNRGKYNIVKDTVLSYIVNMKERIPLSNFEFDLELNTKFIVGEGVNMASYVYKDNHNIVFLVEFPQGTEYVKTIWVNPKKQDIKALKCNKVYKKS